MCLKKALINTFVPCVILKKILLVVKAPRRTRTNYTYHILSKTYFTTHGIYISEYQCGE